MTKDPTSSAWKIIPHFQSRDIAATINFYTTHLHFDFGGKHPEEPDTTPVFCSLAAGKKAAANIYFNLLDSKTSEVFQRSRAWIALGTDELDQLWEELKVKENWGGKITQKIEDKEWGYRQFSIEDLDGNEITFFKFLEGGNPGTD